MTSLWFVTPAFERFEMTAICLEQRRRVIDELAAHGIEGRQVVIADDENLDIAGDFGCDVVERDNEWLGRRFSDGIEYAAAAGADFIVAIGSDSWIDPAYFVPLPGGEQVLTSANYAPVDRDRLAECRVIWEGKGAGPHVFPRRVLEPCGFRPCPDQTKNNRNTDSATIARVESTFGPIAWQRRDLHPLQYVGFRAPPFITGYDRLVSRWGTAEYPDPWSRLARHYPAELVERAEAAMS